MGFHVFCCLALPSVGAWEHGVSRGGTAPCTERERLSPYMCLFRWCCFAALTQTYQVIGSRD